VTPASKAMKNNRPIRLLFAAGFLPFTPDAGRALVRLALDDKAYQQVWHLPTARPALTGREWIDLCADVMGRTPKHMTLSRPMVKLMGLFDPAVREIHEMLYQNEADRLRLLEDRTSLRGRRYARP